MVRIVNGFEFNDPCETEATYRVWTKEPRDLEGKCVATDVTRVRSIGLCVLADRKKESSTHYSLKEGVSGYYAQLMRDMVGLNHTGEKLNAEEKPLGCILNPETYAVAISLYDLASSLTLMAIASENPVTDIVIRNIRFSPDQFSKEELASLQRTGHVPSEHVALQLTTDLYRR